MTASKPTASEINKRFDNFRAILFRDGVEFSTHDFGFRRNITTFGSAKKASIDLVRLALDRSHGRGDWTVKLYGMAWTDTRTDHENKVGFPYAPILTQSDEIFSF